MDFLCLNQLAVSVEKVTIKRKEIEEIGKLSAVTATDDKFDFFRGTGISIAHIPFDAVVHFGPKPCGKRCIFFDKAHDIDGGLFEAFFLDFG